MISFTKKSAVLVDYILTLHRDECMSIDKIAKTIGINRNFVRGCIDGSIVPDREKGLNTLPDEDALPFDAIFANAERALEKRLLETRKKALNKLQWRDNLCFSLSKALG